MLIYDAPSLNSPEHLKDEGYASFNDALSLSLSHTHTHTLQMHALLGWYKEENDSMQKRRDGFSVLT